MPTTDIPTDGQIRAKALEVATLASEKYLQPFREALALSMSPQVQTVPGMAPAPVIPVPWETAQMIAANLATDITTAFEWFTKPDPTLVQGMISTLLRVLGEGTSRDALRNPLADPRLGLVNSVRDAVDDWHGEAAITFKDNYIGRFEQKRTNHTMLVIELVLVLQAFQGIIGSARTKAIEIGEKTRVRLESMPSTGFSDAVLLTIASGVVGLLGAFMPEATVPLAFLSSGLDVAAQWADEHAAGPPSVIVGGDTVEIVVDSMKTAIDLLKQDIVGAQDLLQRAITHDDSLVTLERAKAEGDRDHNNYFFLVRPDVTAGPTTDFTC